LEPPVRDRWNSDLKTIARYLYPNEGEGIIDGDIEGECFFANDIITGRFIYYRKTMHREARTADEFKAKTMAEAVDGKSRPYFCLIGVDSEYISDGFKRFQSSIREGAGPYPLFLDHNLGGAFIDLAQSKPFLRWSSRSPERRVLDSDPFVLTDDYIVELEKMTKMENVPIEAIAITAPVDGDYKTKVFNLPVASMTDTNRIAISKKSW